MATQAPTPDPELVGSIPVTTLEAYIVVGVVVMSAAILMAIAINLATKRPAPSALITALSMLTLFAIAGGLATNNDEAWTIAGTAVGALAGSVTSLFQDRQQKQEVVEQVIEQVREEQDDIS